MGSVPIECLDGNGIFAKKIEDLKSAVSWQKKTITARDEEIGQKTDALKECQKMFYAGASGKEMDRLRRVVDMALKPRKAEIKAGRQGGDENGKT